MHIRPGKGGTLDIGASTEPQTQNIRHEIAHNSARERRETGRGLLQTWTSHIRRRQCRPGFIDWSSSAATLQIWTRAWSKFVSFQIAEPYRKGLQREDSLGRPMGR